MRWFKHFSDARFNLKLRPVIAKFGMEGYGVYWSCLELVAQQGGENSVSGQYPDYSVKAQKGWKTALSMDCGISVEKLEPILDHFSLLGLVSEKALKRGDLSIPKLLDYADEYTDKVGRVSRQYRDIVKNSKKKVPIYSNTIYNIII